MERINAQVPIRQADTTSPASSGQVDGSQQAGIFQGQAVNVVGDASSLLADAAEELTFSVSEEVERSLPERKESEEQRSRLIDQVRLYVDTGDGLNKNEFEQLLKQLTLMASLQADTVVDLVKQHFPDPTDAHAALVQARESFGKDEKLAPEHRAALEKTLTAAIADLEAKDGPNIRAGYNIAGVSPGELRETPQGLRVLYRETIVDFSSYEQLHATLHDRFGPEGFPAAMSFITRALGADMAAMTPSSSAAQLKEIADSIYMMETMGTVQQDANLLVQRLEAKHGPLPFSGKTIAQALFRLREVPMLVEGQILREMSFLISANGAQDAELTQGVRELARTMPHKLFPTPTERSNLLDGLQSILDRAVDREEAEAVQ